MLTIELSLLGLLILTSISIATASGGSVSGAVIRVLVGGNPLPGGTEALGQSRRRRAVVRVLGLFAVVLLAGLAWIHFLS